LTDRPTPAEAEIVELVRSIDVSAPPELHARVQELVAEHSSGRRRRSFGVSRPVGWLAGAAAAAAVVLALVLALSGGSASGPSLTEASAPTMGAATQAAPAESPGSERRLTAAVDGVAFPYWGHRGWDAVGARSDQIAGRPVTTVFYANAQGERIGYAIVGGTPPPHVGSAPTTWHHGDTAYHLVTLQDGANAVVWLRSGRLCILAGRNVDSTTLLRLASWDDHAVAA
jgi:hypothetical protein